jgi:heparan-alpha-glucosaminide N-acetyltransferase
MSAAISPSLSPTVVKRMASIDAYRGMVMFLMLAEVLELMKLANAYPDNKIAEWLRFHTTHVEWVGLSLHDMIQPSFTFLVGVSLPFSMVSRRLKGSSSAALAFHALFRGILLVVLGIVLRSLGKPSTNFTFDDTLTQIGLGYFFLYLIALTPIWSQCLSVIAILGGYWLLFANYPLPSDEFKTALVGVPADWPHLMTGFAAHWNKNMNPAWAFDVWFLNLFPREQPFLFHPGGYATLSFIPTLGTMVLGLLAGQAMRAERSYLSRTNLLVCIGGALLAIGLCLDHYGICPNVKRIWTPSFALISGGICFLWLAALHVICDWYKLRSWAFPLMIIGANSIVAYVMSWTMEKPIKDFLHRHFGETPFLVAGEAWEPVILGTTVLLVMWLVLYWLYRQRIFVRI